MAGREKEPVYVDPLPREYRDSVARFDREVIARASEMPKDELKRLMDAERERQWPYIQMENRAVRRYLAALVGIDPKEFNKPPQFEGCLAKYFPPDCDSVEMIREVRGRGS